jgi:hypothetical protein
VKIDFEMLNHLVEDPNWDCSDRADAHEILTLLRDNFAIATSAPELLAALEAMEDAATHNGKFIGYNSDVMDMARAAIRKAKAAGGGEEGGRE